MTHQHKIPDEVVEAALEVHDAEKWRYELNTNGALNPKEQMRVTLQTALSMLLGEPVGTTIIEVIPETSAHKERRRKRAKITADLPDGTPVYALKEKQS